MTRLYWKAKDAIEFARRFEALCDATKGTPNAPLVDRLGEVLTLEGTDTTAIFHTLAKGASASQLQVLQDIYEAEGFQADGY
ncbi:MAG: hypothetical protein Q7T33_04525 [Dehalococcoidia bacterium]|nr:hypothetical protein [Dehalococcoidia bacterium]